MSYIATSYVKWIESSGKKKKIEKKGGRVVPIPWEATN